MKRIVVAVGVVLRNHEVFISHRDSSRHQGGKWEFPGGKVEDNESVSDALLRELKEEINIDVISQQPFMVIEFDYPDKHVSLDIHLVTEFAGEPKQLEGQEARWVALQDLGNYEFPEANKPIVEKLLSM